MQLLRTTIILLFSFSSILTQAQDSLYLYSTFHGENDQDQFGVVKNVGDVNGDGFEDLLIGAPASIVGNVTNGYAKLYIGGSSFDTLAERRYEIFDEQIRSFGSTIAGNGDLNGDGYDDFAIADYMYGPFQVGKVFIYFGGTELDTIPDLELTLDRYNYFYTRFGLAMAMDGDINHDGYDDLVIGAPYDDWDRHGEVFVYYGGPNMDDVADLNLICKTPLQLFGVYIDYIGDVNGDNFDDLLIGSIPLESDTTTYIFFGDKNGNIGFQNSFAFTKPVEGIVTGLNDVNGDGYSDFAIGSHLFASPVDDGHFNEIFILNKDSVDFDIKAKCPDINNDGFDEIICLATNRPLDNEDVLVAFGGNEISIDDAKVIDDPDDKIGFGRYISSFSNLINDSTVTITIGDKESMTSIIKSGAGKILIYNNNSLVDVKNDDIISQNPKGYILSQNYPNPFNPSTTISYQIPKQSKVKLQLYDLLGRKIATLVSDIKLKGIYSFKLNTTSYVLPSSVYFIKMIAIPLNESKNIYSKTIKIILTK